MKSVDPLLLAVVRLGTSQGGRALTRATGFLQQRGEEVFLVTCRHVFIDPSSGHYPDLVQVDFHTDGNNLATVTNAVLPLYEGGTAVWRQGRDAAGDVDVATFKLRREQMPDKAVWHAFPSEEMLELERDIDLGAPVLIVGFPMGFHDELHHLPVARSGIV
ncbi:serine protease, partial [Roseateles sp. 22389]